MLPDSHIIGLGDWGLRPVLFVLFGREIDSYAFFVGLGLIVAIVLYIYESRKAKEFNENTYIIAIAAVVGGVIGSKIPIWIMNWREILSSLPDLTPLLSGRTITGGLIGGTIAVMLIKKLMGIEGRKGNIFALPIAAGLAIGRIGCLLRGCCFGIHTTLPWGVDFGDHILRHPTQIYESLFGIGLFIYLLWARKQNPKPGQLLSITIGSYFVFRFFLEFIKEEKAVWGPFTIYQWLSVLVLINIFRRQIFKLFVNSLNSLKFQFNFNK